jgi:hypothetical protein
MTTLIRQVVLKHTKLTKTTTTTTINDTNKDNIFLAVQKDLQAILYLASNTVAPAYECIELGIGDAILMKVIGQITGSSPNMIKQQYETTGDLGIVAQTLKSKQSTLSGFFKTTTTKSNMNYNTKNDTTLSSSSTTTTTKDKSKIKTNYLTAQEVWLSFQQIAYMKGNQSQQNKMNIIKKMLLKIVDTMEMKYIIRGLQGKLRIGLAQSTILIAFAHAFTYTKPNTFTISNCTTSTSSIIKEDQGTSCVLFYYVFFYHVDVILTFVYPIRFLLFQMMRQKKQRHIRTHHNLSKRF